MKKILKLLLTCVLFSTSIFATANWWGNENPEVYIGQWEDYGLEVWADLARDTINTIEKERSFSEYIIDIIQYLTTFLTLIWVILVIYAWFTILISWGDEEKLKNARKLIFYVVIWITLIWLAFSIMKWFVSILNGDIQWVES